MAAPRVTIDTLPEKVTLAGTEWFMIQDGTTSKKVLATKLGPADGNKGEITVSGSGTVWNVNAGAITAAEVGLGNVNNTSDANKPISTATQTALNLKADTTAVTAADALKADKTTTITTTAPLAGGGDLSANRTLTVATFSASVAGVVPASGGGPTNYLRADGLWAPPAGSGGGGITTEDAVDATAAAFAAGTHTNVTVTYNDAANSISLAATAAAPVTAQTIEAVAGTTYTVVTADANKIKRLAATATITLPSAGPGVGERVDFVCVGGPATFTLGGGATWDVNPTPSAVARAVGSVVTAVKMTATAWMLTGDLA
jgi:hypothetical protein